MKILLAYLCNYQDRHDYYLSKMPVGIVSIAAYLQQQRYDVALANFSSLGHRKALAHIVHQKPDVLGLSLFTHNRSETLALIMAVKKVLPRTCVVVGGPHATFLAEQITKRYEQIDYIVAGEGEASFGSLLKNFKQGKPPASKIINSEIMADLDDLPPPAAFSGPLIGIQPQEQFSFIITSRGCPHQCAFCSSPRFWNRTVRYRSPEHIVREIEFLYQRYGIRYFSLRDDNFTLDKKRVMKFAQLLRERKLYILWNCQARVDTVDEELLIAMKRAGLEHIQYGVESGSEKVLTLYNKYATIEQIENAAAITRKVGVYLSIYLMTGMYGEDQADTDQTKDLIKRIRPHDGLVSPVALYPGTSLYEQALKRGVVREEMWFHTRQAGLFIRNDRQAHRWMTELILELDHIRSVSRYREQDFNVHRRVAGADCWVTDVLEGDYYLEEKNYRRAQACYQRILENYPNNPWGFLRMKKLKKIKQARRCGVTQ